MSDPQGFIVYTDGSCYTKDRIGSFAWVVVDEDDIEVNGGEWVLDTTISRMELMAPIEALSQLLMYRGPSVALVYSDSEYVVKGITDRNRQRKANIDLWEALDDIVDAHKLVEFEHVPGHSGNYYNELCDKKANTLRREGQQYVRELH
jgi:ribonuclease HI